MAKSLNISAAEKIETLRRCARLSVVVDAAIPQSVARALANRAFLDIAIGHLSGQPVGPSDLCQLYGVDKVAVSHALSIIGTLILRKSSLADGRQKLLTLSPRGEKLTDDIVWALKI